MHYLTCFIEIHDEFEKVPFGKVWTLIFGLSSKFEKSLALWPNGDEGAFFENGEDSLIVQRRDKN